MKFKAKLVFCSRRVRYRQLLTSLLTQRTYTSQSEYVFVCPSRPSVTHTVYVSHRRTSVRATFSEHDCRRISIMSPAGNPLVRMDLKLLPSNVAIVPEIKCFSPAGSSIVTSHVEFINGTVRLSLRWDL